MKISENGINFIINEEGIVLKPYKDQIGIPTIGIGSTYYEDGTKVKLTDKPISKDRAISLFKDTLIKYEDAVNKGLKRVINQNQFDALVSLCYNIGTEGFKNSTVLKRVNNNPCDPTIRDAFAMWNKGDGKVLPVLVGRRKREYTLYFS